MKIIALKFSLFILSGLLAACSSLKELSEVRSAKVLNVEYSKQQSSQLCGVESLKMLSRYYQKEFPQESIERISKKAHSQLGLSGKDMKVFLTDENYFSAIIPGTFDHAQTGIFSLIDQGIPVLVMIKSPQSQIYHYLLVTGYFPESKKVILIDPQVGKYIADSDWFLPRWQSANFFSLIMYPNPKETL